MDANQKFWISFWLIVAVASGAIAWAVVWGMVSYRRANLEAGLVPMSVPVRTQTHYEEQWLPKGTAVPALAPEKP